MWFNLNASFSHIALNSFAVLRTNPRKNQLQISLFVYKVSGKERRNSEVTRISGGKSRLSLVHKFTNHARLSEEIHASRILKLWRNKTMRTITLNSYPATSLQCSPPLMGYCKPFLKVNKQTNISSNNYPSSLHI